MGMGIKTKNRLLGGAVSEVLPQSLENLVHLLGFKCTTRPAKIKYGGCMGLRMEKLKVALVQKAPKVLEDSLAFLDLNSLF